MDANLITALNTAITGMVTDITGLLVTNLPIALGFAVGVIAVFFVWRFVRSLAGVGRK